LLRQRLLLLLLHGRELGVGTLTLALQKDRVRRVNGRSRVQRRVRLHRRKWRLECLACVLQRIRRRLVRTGQTDPVEWLLLMGDLQSTIPAPLQQLCFAHGGADRRRGERRREAR